MDNVRKCLSFRFFESLLSYHTFFTLLLAGGALLLRDKPENMFLLFALLAGYYVVILTFSLLIGLFEDSAKAKILIASYVGIFLIVFIAGCAANLKYALILTFGLVGISFINDKLRFCQTFRCDSEEHPVLTALSKVFETRAFFVLSQSVLIFGAMALLGYFWLFNEDINALIRFVTFGVYCVMIPVFGIFQDNSANAERYEAASREALARYRKEAKHRNYDD